MSEEQSPVPGEVEVEDVVDPTAVRRAPRYGRFIGVGIVLGLVVALGVGGSWLQSDAAESVFKPGVYFTVILVAGAALGAAIGGLWAVLADRRSLRDR
ncbi:histidine kinase [Cellulosimicrobium arenosum]|uniref:Histidine kinase n=1 Tax=Cellulosimicrobium arenosum TaxID=2708133 RepID=A0A927G931_9MICO|nr:histidine kinase [Cellulosimicrobium arenosum]MBD8078814.1 histidine kinase [Cellulosimicrobium arenosum]